MPTPTKAEVDSWFDKELHNDSMDEFIEKIASYEHDYDTIVHAVTAAAIQAARVMNRKPCGGITGFQAGAVMWEFFYRWMHLEGPAKLVQYRDMLFPQYNDSFEKEIPKSVFEYLKIEAGANIQNTPDAHPDVINHWRSIVNGNVPFGYKIKKERDEETTPIASSAS